VERKKDYKGAKLLTYWCFLPKSSLERGFVRGTCWI